MHITNSAELIIEKKTRILLCASRLQIKVVFYILQSSLLAYIITVFNEKGCGRYGEIG